MRLYLHEDSMCRSLVQALRARGVDVIAALDGGMIEREDTEHLGCAIRDEARPCSVHVQRGGFLSSTEGLSRAGKATCRDCPYAAATLLRWGATALPPQVGCEQIS